MPSGCSNLSLRQESSLGVSRRASLVRPYIRASSRSADSSRAPSTIRLTGARTLPTRYLLFWAAEALLCRCSGPVVPESGQLPEIGQIGVTTRLANLRETAVDGGL